MATQPRPYRFTIVEFEQLNLTDVLGDEIRVELIDGEIIEMPPIGPRHARCTGRLTRFLVNQTSDDLIVSVQNPIRVGERSEPLPDLVIYPDREYAVTPDAPNALLVIEVADTSRDYDRNQKFPRYAAEGIAEAWLVDVNARVIERHTEPGTDGYRIITPFRMGEVVTSTVLPGLAVPVAEVFA